MPTSRRYADPETYLIPKSQWPRLRADICEELHLDRTGSERLSQRVAELKTLLPRVDRTLNRNKGIRIEEGQLIVPDDEGEDLPPSAKALEEHVSRRLPHVELPELLLEVDQWTHFSRRLTHADSGYPRTDALLLHFYATLLAQGTNMGLTEMAHSTNLTYERLAWTNTWYLREETLKAVVTALVNFQLSLSRLKHGQPGVQAYPEVVQGTAEFHHEITDARLPQTDAVFHHATALHAAVDMLDPEPPLVERLVGQVLLQGQPPTTGLLRRHEDLHLRECEGQEAQILQQPTPGRERVGGGLRNAQIMHAATVGVTEKEDDEQGIDQQDIFHRVVFFLAAITFGLFSRVLGADDASFRPVMGKRGASGVTVGAGSSSRASITEAASASETPSRWARAVRERAGASPRMRRAVSKAGKRTWIH